MSCCKLSHFCKFFGLSQIYIYIQIASAAIYLIKVQGCATKQRYYEELYKFVGFVY